MPPQVIDLGPSRKDLRRQLLGSALGKGLAEVGNTYFANKALDDVISDRSLDDAPTSERLGRLESALRPFGDKGKELIESRMGIEQQYAQEQKNKIFNKMRSGQPISEKESAMIPPEVALAYDKSIAPPKPSKPTQASQPIDSDQMQRIKNTREMKGFDDLDEVGQYRAMTDNGVSKENAIAEATLKGKQLERQEKVIDSAYKAQEDFIRDTTTSYQKFETEMKPRLLQMQKLATDDELVSPTSAVFLESLGIPLGALDDPSSELFDKLSQDLLKGLPDTYGSRILKVEVDNFLKTIPRLTNSADGRRMIASNMLKLGELKEVYYNEMRREQRKYLDENKPLPRDFEQKIFDQVKPQIDRLNNEFVKLTDIKSVPKGEIPFFDPSGNVVFVPKKDAQWATENGGRRIW